MAGFRYEIGRDEIDVTLTRADYEAADARAKLSGGDSLAEMSVYDMCMHLAVAAFTRIALDHQTVDTEIVFEGHNVIDPRDTPEKAMQAARGFLDRHLRTEVLGRGKVIINIVETHPSTGEVIDARRIGPRYSEARLEANRFLLDLIEDWQKRGLAKKGGL